MSEFAKEELLSAYLDGELTAAERERVEKLLAGDASARAVLDELRAASAAIRGLPAWKLDEDISSRVLAIAERRMLSEAPGDAVGEVDGKPSPLSFWQTAARRFLTPRAFAWSTTAIIVAVILSVYRPEEERRAAQGPIAMQTETDESAPAKLAPADAPLAAGREKRGPGEFRPAPAATPTPTFAEAEFAEKPAAESVAEPAAAPPASAIAAAEAKSAPAMESPSMKAPAMKPAAKKEASPGMGMGMGGGMGIAKDADGRMGMGGPKGGPLGFDAKPADGLAAGAAINGPAANAPAMPGKSLADQKADEMPKGKSEPSARFAKSSLGYEMPGAVSADALQYGAESQQVITVRCYYVSSQEEAQKSLQNILLTQKPPLRSLAEAKEGEAFERERQTVQSKAAPPAETARLDKPQKAIAKAAPSLQQISIEATPAQLKMVLKELGKQQSVFRNYAIDTDSPREEIKLQGKTAPTTEKSPTQQQAAPPPVQQQQRGNRIAARQSGGAADFYSILDEKTNYRIEFIIEAAPD